MSDNCEEECAGAPFDCTCCSRMCEPYGYDDETGEPFYKDLFFPRYRNGMGDDLIKEYINTRITDLKRGDCGAMNIWKGSDGTEVVDIEWNDGFSGFVLKDVMEYLNKHGSVTKSELMEFTY